MKKITLSLLAFAASVMIAAAQAPAAFNYQGIARNSSGAPLANKALGMRVTIHDGASGGPNVFQETQNVTTNAYGLYNVAIGNGVATSGPLSSVNFGAGLKYIQVEVDPNGGTTYTDLGTTQLLSVPYAMYANATPLTLTGNTLTAGGNSVTLPGGAVSGTTNYLPKFTGATALGNSIVYETNSRIGIGTITPKLKLDVTASPTGDTVIGYPGNGSGSFPLNATARIQNTLASTTTTGGYPEPVALVVQNTGGGSSENDGIFVQTTGTGSGALVGTISNARCTSGVGDSYALIGFASSASGSGDAVGVYGLASPSTGTGIALAGFFSGNVQIAGSLAKSSGTFKIDHPLDPENKYLYHSFVESPDMMNIYNGNITTDANGYATITMPAYFDALNKDFRYQLTVMGTFAQAIVKNKMAGNSFRIQTSVPNVEVSWQVTGVRHDKYADAHRVVPEVEKEAKLKGYYLNAAEWNQPESKSISNALMPEKMRTASEVKTGR